VLAQDLLYVYPQWHVVSFSLVSKKHIEYMRKAGAQVRELDELYFQGFAPSMKYSVLIQPGIYIMHKIVQSRANVLGERRKEYWDWWRSQYEHLIGIDVADSDRVSQYAVSIFNMLDKVIVPSNFSRETLLNSGVKSSVHVIPHGVDLAYYEAPNIWYNAPVASINPSIIQLYLYKVKKNAKILLFWLWHSADRKGWPEVKEVYRRIKAERKDVMLVLKTAMPRSDEFQQVMNLGAVEVYGWLNELDKMALYDLADITLVFSRGGGFEMNALESLARGIPALTTDYGSFLDYVPEFLRVRKGEKVAVLPGNAIHVGYGYKVSVDHAVGKILDVLENYEDYKSKTLEWREKVLRSKFRWDVIAQNILSAVSSA
jgi:glycosyltransferase involved in cell wall biosynthesis